MESGSCVGRQQGKVDYKVLEAHCRETVGNFRGGAGPLLWACSGFFLQFSSDDP